MNRKQELTHKLARMREYIAAKKADGLLFQRSDTFAWATCGGEDYVYTATDTGVAALLVTEDDCAVITNRIEANRLKEEELKDLPIRVESIPWAENRNDFILSITKKMKTLSDSPLGALRPIPEDFIDLMMILTESELERYRTVGAATGAAVEAAARAAAPGMTEYEVAARLAAECYNRGVLPVVTLIAADVRLKKYRHPLPKANKLKKTVMLVVCGRARGLIASATRIVSFGPVSADLKRRHKACVQVDAAFNSLTRPGASIADIFRAAKKTYSAAGFDREWLLHHQGGPAGYRPRYYTASDKSTGVVYANSAFAWNPSITGTKSEDTILVLKDKNEFITHTGEWPYIEVKHGDTKLYRPDILVL